MLSFVVHGLRSWKSAKAVALLAAAALAAGIGSADGVPEAQNPREEEFGEERLKNLLRLLAHLPAGEIASRIASELKSWIDNAAQYDDLTFVLVKVKAEGGTDDRSLSSVKLPCCGEA